MTWLLLVTHGALAMAVTVFWLLWRHERAQRALWKAAALQQAADRAEDAARLNGATRVIEGDLTRERARAADRARRDPALAAEHLRDRLRDAAGDDETTLPGITPAKPRP